MERYLRDIGARRVAPGEWGLTLPDVGGAPLEVGIARRRGLLRAQAWVAPPGAVEEHLLLHWNRRLELVRFAHSAAGDVHVHADLPEDAGEELLDRALGALVDAAQAARASVRA